MELIYFRVTPFTCKIYVKLYVKDKAFLSLWVYFIMWFFLKLNLIFNECFLYKNDNYAISRILNQLEKCAKSEGWAVQQPNIKSYHFFYKNFHIDILICILNFSINSYIKIYKKWEIGNSHLTLSIAEGHSSFFFFFWKLK